MKPTCLAKTNRHEDLSCELTLFYRTGFQALKINYHRIKALFALAILLPSFSDRLIAQMPVLINEDSLHFGNSVIPAVSVTIPEVEYEKTMKAWINILQSGTKSKVVSENNDLSIFGAKIKKITPYPVNVYSRLTNQDSMLLLTASFELKKDRYIEKSTAEKELIQAELFLKQFAKDRYIDLVKDQVNAEERKLHKIEKGISSLEKDKSKNQKLVLSKKNLITDEKDNLIVQNNELTTVSSALIGHNSQLNSLDEGPEKEAKLAIIRELEKRKKKALNSIKSSENKINKSENAIRKAEREIPENETDQEKVIAQADQQENILQVFKDKLNKIKKY